MKKREGEKKVYRLLFVLKENSQQVNFIIDIREKEQRTKRKIADNYRFALVAR